MNRFLFFYLLISLHNLRLDFDEIVFAGSVLVEMTKYIADWRRPAVPERIRQGNSRCCLPLLASIGPVFHGLPELKDVEDLKPEISHNFIQDCISSAGNKVDTFKKKLYDVAIEMKSYYSEETRKRFADAQFYKMLLSDVCFVVVVIHGIVSKNERKLPLSSSVLRMCLRDIFLLENQIPFLLVQDLVKLRFESQGTKIIHQLLSAVIHHPLTSNHMDKQPLHLLDLLRHTYIGIGQSPAQGSDSDCPNKLFSAKQIHDRGVRFWEAVSRKIGYSIVQMEFDANFGNLYMPPLLIDESFESIFLNIAAYEASRCDLRKFEVTTYLCLLQHLARDPESVGVLRNNVIRTKEDNKSIVKMFQRMCENLQPNFQPYDRLLSELQFFPSGFIASIICWSRKPSTTHLVSRFFFTSAVLGTIIALANILSFLVNSNKVMFIDKLL